MATSSAVNFVKYNGTLLMKGSHAFELHEKAKFKELEEYLAQLDKAVAKLQGARK